jgi:putative salt-induced outer membrane protein YdiY
VFVAVAIISLGVARADQITLSNGDRLTGKVIDSNEKQLLFDSEAAGRLIIKWELVSGLTTSGPIAVGLADGQMLRGTVVAEGARWNVRTESAGSVTVAKPVIAYLRATEQQALYEAELNRYRNPGLTDLWTGMVDFGYAATRGNARTSNVATSASADRLTSRDKIGARFTSVYASNRTAGRGLTTANAIRGGASYSLDVTKKIFAFASVDLEFDEFQALDLRFVPAGGIGYHIVKNDRGFVDLLGGVSMNREFFSTGLRRTSAEALLGDELSWKLNERLAVKQKLSIFPNMSDPGELRVNFDLTTVTALWKWFGWQFTVSDRFLSNPVAGRRKNDILFTTGLRLTFARPEAPQLLSPLR